MKEHAGIIVVMSIIQMFFNVFLFFVIFLPFAKAYLPCIREKDVYKQNLARLIRNGTHFCTRGAKDFFNAVIGIFQIVMVTLALDDDKDLIEGVHRMSTMNCSNELVNNTILDLAGGVSFL